MNRWAISAAIVTLFGLAAVVVSVGSFQDQELAIVINPTAPPESPPSEPTSGAVRSTPVPTESTVATFGGSLDSPAEPIPIQPMPTPTPTALPTKDPDPHPRPRGRPCPRRPGGCTYSR